MQIFPTEGSTSYVRYNTCCKDPENRKHVFCNLYASSATGSIRAIPQDSLDVQACRTISIQVVGA